MSTTEPATNEPTADDLADAIEQVAQARQDDAVAELKSAMASPLDASLRRGNPRQQYGGPTVWDMAEDMMIVPNMAFDPAQITSLEHYEELDGYAVGIAVSALTELHSAAKRLIDAREAVRANEVRHPAEAALSLDDLHSKLAPEATRKLDAAVATITKAIASHEAKLNEQVKDNAHGAEIRSYVRSLEPGKRLTVLTQAVNKGDAVTVGALLNSTTPAYLGGLELSDEMHAAFLRQWHSKRDPKMAKQLALMQGAVEKLEAAGSIFITSTEALTGTRHKTIQKLRAQREKVRAALGGA